MWDVFRLIIHFGLLILPLTTGMSMCPPMAMNPWASMTPCKQENSPSSGNPGVKAPPPSYCSTDGSKDSKKPSCFSPSSFRGGGSISGNAPREGSLLPTWINIQLARKGQTFAQENLYALLASHVFGLFSSAYPDAIGILCFTGASDTAELAEKRYLATITQFILWYDAMFEEGTNSDSDILASIQRTRAIHIAAAEKAEKQMSKKQYLNDPDRFSNYNLTTALSGPFFRDLQESNIPPEHREPANVNPTPQKANEQDVKYPFNQQIQALMMFSLVGTPVAYPERFGIIGDDEEALMGFSHLWAVLVYAVGVDDKYNVALQPDLVTAKESYKKLFQEYNIRSVYNMNKDWLTLVMAEKSLFGLQQILPVLTPNLILYRMLVDLFQIPAKYTYATLTSAEKQGNDIYEADRKATLSGGKAKMAAMNSGARASLMRDGFTQFGMDYSTQRDKARKVFFTT